MKHDCLCASGEIGICPIHPHCACGCARRKHRDNIGECVPFVGTRCHGCPEYRPAKRQHYAELRDIELEALSDDMLRMHYRALRAHHIEETTVLLARSGVLTQAPIKNNPGVDEDGRRFYEHMLSVRDIDIDSVCKICGGYGTRLYSSTAIWHGGMGGASMTRGVCDQCWGSGDRERHWTNLRTIAERTEEKVAERALTALANSCGASYDSSFDSIRQIIEHLDAFTRKRKVDGIWTAPLANGLANILRRAIGLPEKEMR